MLSFSHLNYLIGQGNYTLVYSTYSLHLHEYYRTFIYISPILYNPLFISTYPFAPKRIIEYK